LFFLQKYDKGKPNCGRGSGIMMMFLLAKVQFNIQLANKKAAFLKNAWRNANIPTVGIFSLQRPLGTAES
jgi:hypothetical protein